MSRPRVSVVIAHYNYASFIETALLSVAEQSMEEWEVVIVDDRSTDEDFHHLRQILAKLDDPRIKLIRNSENLGQIEAIFEGVAAAAGDFIALLDPDDIYEPAYLETMMAALLNPVANAAVAACEMGVFSQSGGALTRHSSGFRMRAVRQGHHEEYEANLLLHGYSDYFSPWKTGWIWAATSGLMFRKLVLQAIRPRRPVTFTRFEGDSYCAIGAHMIGGTVFVDQMLSWRQVHDRNTAKNPVVVFDDQRRMKPEFIDTLWEVKLFVAETILSNPLLTKTSGSALASSILAHIGNEGAMIVAERNDSAKNTLFRYSIGGN